MWRGTAHRRLRCRCRRSLPVQTRRACGRANRRRCGECPAGREPRARRSRPGHRPRFERHAGIGPAAIMRAAIEVGVLLGVVANDVEQQRHRIGAGAGHRIGGIDRDRFKRVVQQAASAFRCARARPALRAMSLMAARRRRGSASVSPDASESDDRLRFACAAQPVPLPSPDGGQVKARQLIKPPCGICVIPTRPSGSCIRTNSNFIINRLSR